MGVCGAWTACDWEVIRTFETKELFEQHKAQLQGYIDNHTVNVMDRICVLIFYFLCKLANAQSWVPVVITLPQYSHLPDDVILVGAPQFGQLVVIDPDFNKEEFIAWSKTLFIKLQQAWTACDWEVIRTFETKELFEQHKAHNFYILFSL